MLPAPRPESILNGPRWASARAIAVRVGILLAARGTGRASADATDDVSEFVGQDRKCRSTSRVVDPEQVRSRFQLITRTDEQGSPLAPQSVADDRWTHAAWDREGNRNVVTAFCAQEAESEEPPPGGAARVLELGERDPTGEPCDTRRTAGRTHATFGARWECAFADAASFADRTGSSGQPMASFEAPGPKDGATTLSSHSGPEPVLLRPPTIVGLKRTLHGIPPEEQRPERRPVGGLGRCRPRRNRERIVQRLPTAHRAEGVSSVPASARERPPAAPRPPAATKVAPATRTARCYRSAPGDPDVRPPGHTSESDRGFPQLWTTMWKMVATAP